MRRWLALAAIVGGGGWLLSRRSSSSPSTADAPAREPWSLPVWLPNGPEGRAIIEQALCNAASPDLAADDLRRAAWREIWPGVPWPVLPDDHPSVLQAAGLLDDVLEAYLDDAATFCAQPNGDESATPTPINPAIVEDPDGFPAPGTQYQIVKNDILGGEHVSRSIIFRALLRAGHEAALAAGMSDDDARAFALELARDKQARARARNLLLCQLFNDLYYTTYGWGSQTFGGPHGRGLRLLPQHADNRARMLAGDPPIRVMDLGSPADKGQGNRTGIPGGSHAYISIPLLDLVALADVSLPIDERIAYGRWPDGSSGAWPHPSIRTLMRTADLPAGNYGCAPDLITVS